MYKILTWAERKRAVSEYDIFTRIMGRGKINEKNGFRVHFIGIFGVGMYSLARITKQMGIAVTGSDREKSQLKAYLDSAGIITSVGHKWENVEGADVVVYSLAISEENEELEYAVRMRIPTFTRAEYMGILMQDYNVRIGISGSHGKSTVTAMTSHIFSSVGKLPTVISGAKLPSGEPTLLGEMEYLIYEACEYKDSFLKLSPSAVTVTNLELDHTDYFKDLDDIKHSFLMCINRAEDFAVLNSDDENLSSIMPLVDVDFVTYGARDADYTYSMRSFARDGIKYAVKYKNKNIGEYFLRLKGAFNIANATAAISTAAEYGISVKDAGKALESFSGVGRRMEYVGCRQGRAVYYDYAHHPTEISAVINTLIMTEGTVTVVFKPHTYTRTRDLWDDFVAALAMADFVILTDIYPAREESIDGISSERLAKCIGDKAIYVKDKDVPLAVDRFTSGSIVLMGAGDNEAILKSLLEKNIDR